MGRHSCCYKQKLRKGLWSPEEDEKLLNYISKHGHGCWSSVPKLAGLQRCGKSCRLRWINYLRPDLKRGAFSQEEESLIIELHAQLGNRWSQIASRLPGRTDNEIKNLWNSCLKKKLRQRGIDPNTHKPLSEVESDKDKQPTTTNKSYNKLAFISNELDLVEAAKISLRSPNPQEPPSAANPSRNNNLTTTTHELFQDRPSDMVESFPFQKLGASLGRSVNPNTSFCELLSSDQFNQSTITPIMSTSVFQTPISVKPSVSLPSDNRSNGPGDVNLIPNWEVSCSFSNNGSTSNGSSSSGIELQSNNSTLFDNNNTFSWGLPDCTAKTGGEVQLVTSLEDTKWPEYLNIPPVFLGSTMQNHSSQAIYSISEVKPEPYLLSSGSSSGIWNQNQQHQTMQAAPDVYAKDLQRFAVSFGQTF